MTGKLAGIGHFENLCRALENALGISPAEVAFYRQTIDGV